jgi:hypothetical protein
VAIDDGARLDVFDDEAQMRRGRRRLAVVTETGQVHGEQLEAPAARVGGRQIFDVALELPARDQATTWSGDCVDLVGAHQRRICTGCPRSAIRPGSVPGPHHGAPTVSEVQKTVLGG